MVHIYIIFTFCLSISWTELTSGVYRCVEQLPASLCSIFTAVGDTNVVTLIKSWPAALCCADLLFSLVFHPPDSDAASSLDLKWGFFCCCFFVLFFWIEIIKSLRTKYWLKLLPTHLQFLIVAVSWHSSPRRGFYADDDVFLWGWGDSELEHHRNKRNQQLTKLMVFVRTVNKWWPRAVCCLMIEKSQLHRLIVSKQLLGVHGGADLTHRLCFYL